MGSVFRAVLAAPAFIALLPGGAQENAAGVRPSFEVASVRYIEHPDYSQRVLPNTDPSLVAYRRVPLSLLLMKAFGVSAYQCDSPPWADEAVYDLLGKLPAGATSAQVPAMIERVLVERFGLKFHWATRTEDGYGLIVGRKGPRLERSDPAGSAAQRESIISSAGRMQLLGFTMGRLAGTISTNLGRPVVDMTGLGGTYDIVLDFDPSTAPRFAAATGQAPDEPLPKQTFAMAIESLGLKLAARRVPARHLVVDHIEKIPTPN